MGKVIILIGLLVGTLIMIFAEDKIFGLALLLFNGFAFIAAILLDIKKKL